jgi:hypothetical protein
MKYWLVAALGASLLTFPPGPAAAQCEGGTGIAGYYQRDGVYVPGGCAVTNPLTPGQLHRSGALPATGTAPGAVVTTPAAPAAAVRTAESTYRVAPSRVRETAAPLPLRVGDPTGAYGASLPVAPAVSADGSASVSLLHGGDPTGAYGTTLVPARSPEGITRPPRAEGE